MDGLAELNKNLERLNAEVQAAWRDAEARLEGVRRVKLGDLNLRDDLYQEMKPVFRQLYHDVTLRSAFFRAGSRGRRSRRLLLVFMSELIYWEYERSFWKKLYEVLELEGKVSDYRWFTSQMVHGYRENDITLIHGWGGRREYVRTIIGESGFSRQLVQQAKRFVIWFFDHYSSLDPRKLDRESFDEILDRYLDQDGDLNKDDLFDLLRDMIGSVIRLLREIRRQYLGSADLRDPEVLADLEETLGFHPIRGIFGFRKREDIQELLEQLSRRMRPNTFYNHLRLKARQGFTLRVFLPDGEIVEAHEPADIPIIFGEYQIVAPRRSTIQVVPREALSIRDLAERIEQRAGVFHPDKSRYAWFHDDESFKVYRGSTQPRESRPYNIAGQTGHLWYGKRMIGIPLQAKRNNDLLDELAPRRDVWLNPRLRLNWNHDGMEVVIPSFVCYEPRFAGRTVRLELNGRPIEATTYVLDQSGALQFQGTRTANVLPDDNRLEVALVTLEGQVVTSHTVYASLERSFLFNYAREVVYPSHFEYGGRDFALFAPTGVTPEAGDGVVVEPAAAFGDFQIWDVHWESDPQDHKPFDLVVGEERWEIVQPLEVFITLHCATKDGLFRPQEPNSAYSPDDIDIRLHLRGNPDRIASIRPKLLLIIEKDGEFVADFSLSELTRSGFLLAGNAGDNSSRIDSRKLLAHLLEHHLINQNLGSYRLTLMLRHAAGEAEKLSEGEFFLLPRLSVIGQDDFVAEGEKAEMVVYGQEPVLSGTDDLPTAELWLSFVPRAAFNTRNTRICPCPVQKTVRLNYPPVKVDLDFLPRIFATRLLVNGNPVGQPRISYDQLSKATLLVLSTPRTRVTVHLGDFEAAFTTDAMGNAQYDLRRLKQAVHDVINVVSVSSQGLERSFDIVWYPSFSFQKQGCHIEERASEIILHLVGKADGLSSN